MYNYKATRKVDLKMAFRQSGGMIMSVSSFRSIQMQDKTADPLEALFLEVITHIGEDPRREGLLETPRRIAKMYREIFSGIHEDPMAVLQKTFPSEGTKDIIIVQDIPFYSVCEHHFVPFYGKAHIGYIPQDRIVGLSKFARLVETFARRPQVQEKLTNQLANTIFEAINPRGVIVVVEAEHMCMSMRGIKKPGSLTRTLCRLGEFEHEIETEKRFFKLLKDSLT